MVTSESRISFRYDNDAKRYLVERTTGTTIELLGRLLRKSFDDPEVYLELEPGAALGTHELVILSAYIADISI